MKLTEAWHLSRIPYREVVYRSLAEERGRMWWGAFGRSHFDKETQGDIELTKRALRIAKFDKSIVAVFCVISAVMPFTSLFSGSALLGLTSSISLSLAVTFGFTALYAIQTLSSFVSTESSALLSTLPLSKNDFSRITLFSFIRSVDYMVVASISSQVTLVAYLTASPLAALLMLGASIMNSLFAVAIALWFSRLFYRNLLHGGRSKGATALRLVFILMWGSLLLGVGILLSVPWYIVPHLEKALLGIDQISSLPFFIIYPFSAGITITNLVHPNVAFSTALTASVAMVGYVIVAGVTGKWILETVKHISQGTGVKVVRIATKDFSIKTRNPLLGYIMKDLRISSRNPATAFFFALPILETVIILLLLTNYAVLRTSTILVATTTGGIFALLMPLALLSAEGTGLEYTKTLPVNVKGIIACKTLISTATYIPVPLALLGMAFMKPLTSSLAILIPCITILAIASASIFEIRLFLGSVAKGRIAALMLDVEKLTVGVTITLVPAVAYTATYFVSFDHVLAILIMSVAAVSELAMAVFILNASEHRKF
jgi:predicted permease